MASQRGKRSRVATEVGTSPETAEKALSVNPLYGVAMLKIALELKKADARPMEQLISGVLGKMGLDEGEFQRFLDVNGGLLRALAQKS